jgi:hypothetical protein
MNFPSHARLRRVDALAIDILLYHLGVLSGGEDLAIPAHCVHGAPASEIEDGDVPIDPQRKHWAAHELSHHVVAREATHGARELTRHHCGMSRIDQAGSHFPSGGNIRQLGGPHEFIHG